MQAEAVQLAAGDDTLWRFCQQCGKFEHVQKFDDAKRWAEDRAAGGSLRKMHRHSALQRCLGFNSLTVTPLTPCELHALTEVPLKAVAVCCTAPAVSVDPTGVAGPGWPSAGAAHEHC